MKTIFEDAVIGIRPFRLADADPLLLAAQESRKELCRWMVWYRPEYNLDDSRAFIARSQVGWSEHSWFAFVIYGTRNGEFLGSIGLKAVDFDNGFAHLGYWVRTKRTLHGFATAAVRLAGKFAFGELGLHRLDLIMAEDNLGGLRVAEKAGASREGVLRRRLTINGMCQDALIYALLRQSPIPDQ